MGIVTIFLKNIPEERHIDSLEVNIDLSDLSKQNIEKPTRIIKLDEYFKILSENNEKWKSYVPGKGLVLEIHVYKCDKWRGLFETARNTALKNIGLIAEKKVHIRGRYDLINSLEAEELENKLLQNLENKNLEGTVLRYESIDSHYSTIDRKVKTGLIYKLECGLA